MPSDIAEGAREDYGSSDTLSSAEQNAAAVPGVWEEELMSQRDAALVLARELSQQLDQQKATLERRAKNAEALRESSQEKYLHCKTRQRNEPEVHMRLAALVGGSLSAWLICVAVGLAWAPRASLALGIPCTLVMAAVCSRRMPRPRTKRRNL